MESKQQQTKSIIELNSPKLLDLPDEILATIVVFMFADNHREAISTISLVCKHFNENVLKKIIYEKFFPGLLHNWKRRETVPRLSFYLIVKSIENMKDGYVTDDLKYLTLEYLVPAYALFSKNIRKENRDCLLSSGQLVKTMGSRILENESAMREIEECKNRKKEPRVGVKKFLYDRIAKCLTEFADEVDVSRKALEEKDASTRPCRLKRFRIRILLTACYCNFLFTLQTDEIDQKYEKITQWHISKR